MKKLKLYVVSATLIKTIPSGLNIITDLRRIKAYSKEEATGKYVCAVSEEFNEHYIHIRPLVMKI